LCRYVDGGLTYLALVVGDEVIGRTYDFAYSTQYATRLARRFAAEVGAMQEA
jgi:hypothetical protein